MISQEEKLRLKYFKILPHLDERQRRLLLATEVLHLGTGSVSLVARSSGVSRSTIRRGLRELSQDLPGKVRQPGGGRKRLVEHDLRLPKEVESLLETRYSGLQWTCLTNHQLAEALGLRGFPVSHQWVHRTLIEMGFLRSGPCRSRKLLADPDRARQMHYLSGQIESYLDAALPVLLVEVSSGLEGRFLEDEVSSAFTVDCLAHWWSGRYSTGVSHGQPLLICLQGQGTGSSWQASWKQRLAGFAYRHKLTISVSHLAPAAIRWKSLHQRLVTRFEDQQCKVIVKVAQVGSAIQPPTPPRPAEGTSGGLARVVPHDFRGDWNYTLQT